MDLGASCNDDEGPLLEDVSKCRRIIDRLLYLTISRPDISQVVHKLSKYMSKPKKPRLNRIYHILQYLKGTSGQGIMFSSNSSLHISAYSDADWGSCITTRKSTTSFASSLKNHQWLGDPKSNQLSQYHQLKQSTQR